MGCGHWGWGAVMVDTAPMDWSCPRCGARTRKRKEGLGRHHYLFEEPCCTGCARAWHDSYCKGEPYGE